MTLETAVSIQKNKVKANKLEDMTTEANKENVLLVNSRDQDRFRNEKTLESIASEMEDVNLTMKQTQMRYELMQREHEALEEKHQKLAGTGELNSDDDESMGKSISLLVLICTNS